MILGHSIYGQHFRPADSSGDSFWLIVWLVHIKYLKRWCYCVAMLTNMEYIYRVTIYITIQRTYQITIENHRVCILCITHRDTSEYKSSSFSKTPLGFISNKLRAGNLAVGVGCAKVWDKGNSSNYISSRSYRSNILGRPHLYGCSIFFHKPSIGKIALPHIATGCWIPWVSSAILAILSPVRHTHTRT